jgi:mannose-6-phosphate isomerase
MRGDDGLFRSTFEDGQARGLSVYDNAFGLLALAHGFRVTGEARLHDLALATWAALGERYGVRGGGFSEEGRLEATSHMHLYEAATAWRASTDEPVWREAATQVGDLSERLFLDLPRGRVRPQIGDERTAESYEPGQALEWGWLLIAEGRIEVGRRLIEAAFRSGVSRSRNLALNLQDEAGGWLDAGARLWPQTERLHAALSYGAATAELDAPMEASLAAAAVEAFLAPAPRGLFRDSIDPGGSLDRGAAKASSLYHFTGAILAARP